MRLFNFRLKNEYQLYMSFPYAQWWGQLCILLLLMETLSSYEIICIDFKLCNAIKLSFWFFMSLGIFRIAKLHDNMTCGCCGQKIDKSKQ